MRTPLLATALLGLHLALLLAEPGGAAAPAPGDLRVGVVLDVGGLGDKSFNDGSWAGAREGARLTGAQVSLFEPGEGADREAGLRLFAAEGYDLVIGVGFVFTDDLLALASEYPRVSFAGVDLSLRKGDPVPPNLAVLRFREEQGAFLVGALAALAAGGAPVGFVGGMDIPLIHRFEAGYRAGVQAVCAACKVVAQFAGVTPEAFRNPSRGKELALSQYQAGVEVIFHASGSTGLGVFEAARQEGALAIGVDADQRDEAPGHVLTSMIKRVDQVVKDQVLRVHEGTFAGGVHEYGLAEDGVGYVLHAEELRFLPAGAVERVEALKRDVIEGRVKVPFE